MPKFEGNAARKIQPEEELFAGVKKVEKPPRPLKKEIFPGVKAVHKVPRPEKRPQVAEALKAEEEEVKKRLQEARGRIGVPVEEAPEEVEVDLTELERGEKPRPPAKILEEAEGLTREKAQLEKWEKETRGMDIKEALEILPNAAHIWDRLQDRLKDTLDPTSEKFNASATLALMMESEKYTQKVEDPVQAYVFALAKYMRAYNEFKKDKTEDNVAAAEYELLNLKHLTETLGLGKVEIRKRKLPPEAAPEYDVDLSDLDDIDVDLSEFDEFDVDLSGLEEEAPESGVRKKKSRALEVPEPYVAKFSEIPGYVKEQVAKDTERFYEDVAAKEENAREILGRTYNLIGRVNELISSHPAAKSLLENERAKYGFDPSDAEAFMMTMADFIDARDRNDIEGAKRKEADVRKIADAIGLTGNAQFESTMARPTYARTAGTRIAAQGRREDRRRFPGMAA